MSEEKKPKILVVEDNTTSLKIYANRLGAAGFDIIETPSATDVVHLIDSHSPDAFVIDLMLQDGDGFEIIKKVRAHKKGKKKPIIVLSNLSQQKDIDEATAAGADRYFIKSDTNLSEIIAAIQQLL